MSNNHNKPLFTRKALAAAISSVYMAMALVPSYASDTEIYTQTVTSSAAAPTVMMVLDTSGSMEECIDSSSGDTCATESKKRIKVLRSALGTVLLGKVGATPETTIDPAPGFVKMGYARFNPDANKGGWVRYPARPLDALVEISPDGIVNQYGANGKSDTVQTSSVPNGNTLSTLTIGSGSNVGLSFSGVMLPKGAVVTEAYIELTASNEDISSGEWLVSMEDDVNPADYTSSGPNGRSYYSIDVSHVPVAWTASQKYTIPVSSLVNQMVNRSAWCGGNNINFKIANKEASSLVQRRAYAFDSTTADVKPKLFVRYTIDPKKTDSCIKMTRSSTFSPQVGKDDAYYYDSWTNMTVDDDSLYVNYISSGSKLRNVVRFPNLTLNKNATITSAVLSGQSSSTKSVTGVQPINVEAFNTGNVTAFCSGSSCPKPSYTLTSPVLWSPGTIPKASNGRISQDVTSLVQGLVNRSDWAVGNAMGFRLSNSTTTTNDKAVFATVDNSLSSAMNLSITWTAIINDLTELRTVREDILADLDYLDVEGGTPLGAAYAEASRYMLGMEPDVKDGLADFGDGVEFPVHDPRTLNAAQTTFVSPVSTSGCSGNYIFMMSDGDPNNLANVNNNTKGITGAACSNEVAASGSGKQLNWYCMFDLALWNMKSNNQIGAPIHTTTVYFGPTSSTNSTKDAAIKDNIANMKTVATNGDGDAFQATDEAKLVDALTQTVKKAVDAGGTIAAPGVAVNQLNRLSHLNQLYYAVFEPKPKNYRWDGNVKRYKLSTGGVGGDAIVDVNDANAVDASTGFFKETSQSFWSEVVDGNRTVEGGVASKLPKPDPADATDNDYRHMFTYMKALDLKNQPLTAIKVGDATFDAAAKIATGVSNSTEYTNLMNWYKGYVIPDLVSGLVSTTGAAERNRMGGALHSQPVVINYGYTGTLSGSVNPDNQKNIIFISTLEGTLHGIDAKTGIEKFSFIPGEKLSTLKSRYENPTSVNPEFGMDLTWTFYREDANKDGQIGSGDKIYMYGGMRMGGNNYYALDVTSLDSPKFVFAIDGGSTGAYARMGQSWSQPVLTNIKVAGVTKKVMVFGGGYDDRHEVNDALGGVNDKGNQLYIVNAITGDLIWFASGNSEDTPNTTVSDMKYSVPTSPNVVDLDGDGNADAIYFGDLGGQVFRADLNNQTATDGGIVKRVKLLAKLGETNDATTKNLRRFFEPPAVALFKDSDGKTFATVAQGSGYRSHPLDTLIDEHFYVFFDYDLPRVKYATDASLQSVIVNSDLEKLDLTSTSVQTNGVNVTGKRGWYVDLPESGEKSLATPLIFKSKLVFSTFSPVISGGNCSPVIGKTKLYTFCMPYGKLCSTTPTYAKDNVMVGLGGTPQLMIVQDPNSPTPSYEVKLVTGTSLDGDIFSDSDVSVKFQPAQKWHEKTGN